MRRLLTRSLAARLAAGALALAALPALAPDNVTAQPDGASVIASGLDNPRGITFAPDGSLYVAEAGRGGEGACVMGPEGDEVCFGMSGAITRIAGGQQSRVATGLPSLAAEGGNEATGPHDVAVHNGTVYAIVGLGANPAARAEFGANGVNFGTLVRLTAGGGWQPVVDVSSFESIVNPDGGDIDSNPYALLAEPGYFVVADAGGNNIVAITLDAAAENLATFPSQMVAAPPFLMAPPGTMLPAQSVPTSVVRGLDGAYYVGELTGFPFPNGGARVWRVVPGAAPTVYASGFTNIIDLAFDSAGNLYVLEIAANGLLSMVPDGALHKVSPNGTHSIVIDAGLEAPGGIAIGPDGAIYISNKSTSAGEGEILRWVP